MAMHSCHAHCGPVQAAQQHPSWLPELISDFEPLLPSIDSVPLPGELRRLIRAPFCPTLTIRNISLPAQEDALHKKPQSSEAPGRLGRSLLWRACQPRWRLWRTDIPTECFAGAGYILQQQESCCCSGEGHGLQDGSCAGRARVGECAAAGAACGAAPPRLRAVRAHRCAAAEVRQTPLRPSLRPMRLPACGRPSLITCMAADIQHSPCLFCRSQMADNRCYIL